MYYQIYGGIQQEPDRLKKSYALLDSVATLTLPVVREVKGENIGI